MATKYDAHVNPYCVAWLKANASEEHAGTQAQRTPVVEDNAHPEWKTTLKPYSVWQENAVLRLQVGQ